jgi:hypothetical protein
MSFLSERLLKLTRRLYPTGRAFKLPENGVLERLHISLNKIEESTYLDAIGILDTLLPDNDNFTAEDALDWEVRLGITLRDGVTLTDRKAAILRKMNHPGDKLERGHYLFIQHQLQLAGFRVWVYENRFPDGGGGFSVKSLATFVTEFYNTVFLGIFQHGQRQHGQINGFSGFEKVANYLTNAEDSAVIVANGRQTFFIGGDEPGKFANVLAERETELRKVILQLKPVESAALLAIRYGDGIFDATTGFTNPTNIDFNLKFQLVGNRLFYQTALNTTIKIWDIIADAQIPGEEFGAAVIFNSISLHIDSTNNKAYILDIGGTPQVRVFNTATGAAIPGENFGSGTVTANSKDLIIYDGEAYVYDSGGTGNIFVFIVSTGVLDRTLSVNSTTIKEIAINETEPGTGRIYASEGTTNLLRLFDLQGVEDTDNQLTGLNNPLQIVSENGYLYLCNNGEGVLKVYDIFRGAVEVTTLGMTAAGILNVAISDQNLVLTDGVTIWRREKNT